MRAPCAVAAVALYVSTACSTTTVETLGVPGSGGGPPSGPACTWVAQDGSHILCPVEVGISCPGPAGSHWCSKCACADPSRNAPTCGGQPCSISCSLDYNALPDGGCSFVFSCDDGRGYDVKCPGSGRPCQCSFLPKFGQEQMGQATAMNLCPIAPADRLQTINDTCGWHLYVKK